MAARSPSTCRCTVVDPVIHEHDSVSDSIPRFEYPSSRRGRMRLDYNMEPAMFCSKFQESTRMILLGVAIPGMFGLGLHYNPRVSIEESIGILEHLICCYIVKHARSQKFRF